MSPITSEKAWNAATLVMGFTLGIRGTVQTLIIANSFQSTYYFATWVQYLGGNVASLSNSPSVILSDTASLALAGTSTYRSRNYTARPNNSILDLYVDEIKAGSINQCNSNETTNMDK